MFKLFLVSVVFILSLQADLLEDKIKVIIGEKEFTTHQNLINYIFKNRSNYQYGESLNYISVLKKLNEKGLLKLGFAKPKDILIEFQTNSNPLKSLKILKDTLKSLGYYYYFTKSTQYNGQNSLIWNIKLKTEAAIDPLVLSNELLKKDCRIMDIQREGDKWTYVINTDFAVLKDAVYVTTNERVVLKKPLKPYFIRIDEAKQVYIVSRILNKWFPNVVFYDKHLNILNVTNKNKVYRNIKLAIPEGTKYIKISDLYTLINIKRGLSVVIKE
jgi:hypothetical protein